MTAATREFLRTRLATLVAIACAIGFGVIAGAATAAGNPPPNGCKPSGNKPKKCSPAPAPSPPAPAPPAPAPPPPAPPPPTPAPTGDFGTPAFADAAPSVDAQKVLRPWFAPHALVVLAHDVTPGVHAIRARLGRRADTIALAFGSPVATMAARRPFTAGGWL